MTRETKVGLLVSIGVVLLIGIIISDQLAVIQKDGPSKALARFGAAAQKSIFASRFADSNAPENSNTTQDYVGYNNKLRQSQNANGWPESTSRRHFSRQTKIQTPDELRNKARNKANRKANRDLPPRAFALDKSSRSFSDASNSNRAVSRTGQSSYQPVKMTLSGKPPRNANPDSHKKTAPTRSSNDTSGQKIIHTVQNGETLYQIAVHYYHKGTDWRVIAKANPKKIGTDGQVRAGEKLVIPNDNSAIKSSSKPKIAKTSSAAKSTKQSRTIKVKPGDTLAGLAHKYLGSSAKWHKILKANLDKLKEPRDLRSGMTLVIPK